jgi:hypothetical protein
MLHGVQSADDRRSLPIFREPRLPVRSSSVNLTKHDVLRADDSDHVGKHVTLHHF